MHQLKQFWFQLTAKREAAGLVVGFVTLLVVFLPLPFFGLVLVAFSYLLGWELEQILRRSFLRFVPPVVLLSSLSSPYLGLLTTFLAALTVGYFQVRLRGYYSEATFKSFLEVIFVGTYAGILPSTLFVLKEHSTYLLLSAVLAVWAADTAAYYVGKKFGNQPLVLLLSPSKTWEGFLGGLFAGTLVGAVSSSFFGLNGISPFSWLVVILMSVAGDLFESYLKRSFNVKDSSNLLGSHGGILDRFDALLFASLTLAAFISS